MRGRQQRTESRFSRETLRKRSANTLSINNIQKFCWLPVADTHISNNQLCMKPLIFDDGNIFACQNSFRFLRAPKKIQWSAFELLQLSRFLNLVSGYTFNKGKKTEPPRNSYLEKHFVNRYIIRFRKETLLFPKHQKFWKFIKKSLRKSKSGTQFRNG